MKTVKIGQSVALPNGDKVVVTDTSSTPRGQMFWFRVEDSDGEMVTRWMLTKELKKA